MRSGTCRKFPKSVHICLVATGVNNAITNHSELETEKETVLYQAGENMQLVPNAGIHATDVKLQTRKDMQPV